jgi:hypothetical protein
MEIVNRSISEITDLGIDDKERQATFVISTKTKDRHGTVLNQENWSLDNYMRNPIVGYQHNVYGDMCGQDNPDNIIGKSSVYIDTFKGEKALIARATFETEDINPLADKVWKKIKFGTLRMASVGFSPVGKGKFGEGEEARGKSNETYYFEGQELLEWSVVKIPSNPDAEKLGLQRSTENAIKYISEKLGINQVELLSMKLEDVVRVLKGEIKEIVGNDNIENQEAIKKELEHYHKMKSFELKIKRK